MGFQFQLQLTKTTLVYIHVFHVHDVIGDVERKKERKTPEAIEK